MTVSIIIGSSSVGWHSRTPAQWISNKLESIAGISSEIVDLWEYPLQFFQRNEMDIELHSDFNYSLVKKWQQKIENADVLILVCPAKHPSYSNALRRALTQLSSGWENKPQCTVNYGSQSDRLIIDQISFVAVHLKLSEQNGSSNALWNFILSLATGLY